MQYVGMDVHWRRTSVCILDENGRRVKRFDVRGAWEKVLRAWDQIKGRWQVCFEASCGYGWLYERLKAMAERVAVAHPGVELLMDIPGVGIRTAEAVMAYVDDPHRFHSLKAVGSYFGLVPCQAQSAGKNRLGHITRQGPATVRKLLTEASWQAIRRSDKIRAYFERIRQGNPDRKKIALVATAHYLLRVMLSMLKTGELWRVVAA